MKRSNLALVIVFVLLLTACSSQPGNAPIKSALTIDKPQPLATDGPYFMDGKVTTGNIAEAAKRLLTNPDDFGAFFAEYMEKNKDKIVDFKKPGVMRNGFILPIDKYDLNVSHADGKRALIFYKQHENTEASLKGKNGLFLDCMAQLPKDNIPASLVACDTFIQMTAIPETVFTYTSYGAGILPAIRWRIDVSYIDMTSGAETWIESFIGSDPPASITVIKGTKYFDGSFPMQEAVNCALKHATGTMEMEVSSRDIVDGDIWPQYGMFGGQMEDDVPTRSFPISINYAPDNTVCYAIKMTDPDSVPLCGYEWFHWTVVNLKDNELPEDASITMAADMVQGENDFGKIGYGGPTPPDKPHTYVITVYALDSLVQLENGFTKEQFDEAIKGHVLAEASMKGRYSNEIGW
ncbi:MAG TPA: YbhB/YbcL family Raf kinase inhibitor-like protein [Clostridiaceae bacterium]|jgi:Raf kinase inhibitor-like YbhB/YbcL family protein|nr:YbhB/YbcL family Raf kinase inhibitor-like protein [Clostridiaceae bacterium]